MLVFSLLIAWIGRQLTGRRLDHSDRRAGHRQDWAPGKERSQQRVTDQPTGDARGIATAPPRWPVRFVGRRRCKLGSGAASGESWNYPFAESAHRGLDALVPEEAEAHLA